MTENQLNKISLETKKPPQTRWPLNSMGESIMRYLEAEA
jgi:hypothetical protein